MDVAADADGVEVSTDFVLVASFGFSYKAEALNRFVFRSLLIFLNLPKRFSNKLIRVPSLVVVDVTGWLVVCSFCAISNLVGRAHDGCATAPTFEALFNVVDEFRFGSGDED